MYLIPSAPLSRSISDYPEGIVLPIDKPYTWTSADVIRKIKYAAIRHFGKIKVGHAGTLDPLATGMLLVCLGAATKKAELLQGSDKEYVAGVSFGATTASFDLEKPIDRICPPVSREALEKALPSFLGEQQQVAPLFSAKSVDGVRAYETARKLYREALRSGGDFASIAEAPNSAPQPSQSTNSSSWTGARAGWSPTAETAEESMSQTPPSATCRQPQSECVAAKAHTSVPSPAISGSSWAPEPFFHPCAAPASGTSPRQFPSPPPWSISPQKNNFLGAIRLRG